MRRNFLILLILCLVLSLCCACAATETPASDAEDEESCFTITFETDEYVSVRVFNTQDMTTGGAETTVGYARDADTGEILIDGSGQINFLLTFDDGYELGNMSVSGTYNKIKGAADTGMANGYRITKIASDLTVSITSKVAEESGDDTGDNTGAGAGDGTVNTEDSVYSAEADGLTVVAEYTTNTENYSAGFTYSQESDYIQIAVIDADSTGEAEITLSGEYNGSVWIYTSEETDLVINLAGLTVNATGTYPAIYISEANNADISAKKNTTNYVYDNRAEVDALGSAIYCTCDLKLKGAGTLTVVSASNNGIHTKDDLTVQKLTLNITSVDNALKGNDGVEIVSGTLTLVSTKGDGIKTSNSEIKYNDDGSVKKVQGTVSITGGQITIYSASDGIDAAYNVEISGSPEINIYTTKTYAGSKVLTAITNSDEYYYIRYTAITYSYSVYFRNSTTGDYIWVNPTGYDKVSSSGGNPGGGPGGGFGGQGGSTAYYYYSVPKPDGEYDSMTVYAYTSSQTQGQSSAYYAKSDALTVNTARDTVVISSISSSGKKLTTGWATYSGDTTISSKGIKSDNEIYIKGGTINIKSYDDGIHANNDVVLGDEDDTADDYYGTGIIYISGGTIKITTKDDGIHADADLYFSESDATLNLTVLTSYEGIEANRIYFNAGTVKVYATDDGVNAAECTGCNIPQIVVSGGYLEVNVSPNGDTDGIDSNGTYIQTGGIVIAKGPNSEMAAAVDADGSVVISGGTLIVLGYGSVRTSGSGITTYSLSLHSSGSHTVKIGGTSYTFNNDYSYGRTTCYSSVSVSV